MLERVLAMADMSSQVCVFGHELHLIQTFMPVTALLILN